jgi:hypothetical protein
MKYSGELLVACHSIFLVINFAGEQHISRVIRA